MKIEIKREKRKTLSLKILDCNNAVVKAPVGLGESKIKQFIESKKLWIEKTVQKFKEGEQFEQSFDFQQFVYIFGEPSFEARALRFDFDKLADVERKRVVRGFYLTAFSKLEEMVERLSKEHGIAVNKISILHSKRIWGSFSTKREMKLNWRLLILSKELVEYVVCHELCHSFFMNHKPQFWKAVYSICPNYKNLRKELQKYSFVLRTDKI